MSGPRCSRCGAPGDCAPCKECLGRGLAFESAWAPFAYEGVARSLVRTLKSRGGLAAARPMARAIHLHAPAGLLGAELVPVPAHRGRLLRDGYNPAGQLAGALAQECGLRSSHLLRRRPAARQTGRDRDSRISNASGSVTAVPKARIPGRVVLVDDVYTTGATLDACARVLKAEGCSHIAAITFARTVRGL